MRNFFVPHSTQMERVAARPFFMVTASMSLDPVRALHLTQYISTALEGVVIVGRSWGRMAVSIVTRRGASPTRRRLATVC